ncbi:MAG: hypothetical protein GY821_03470 [Gammaproteobacteria bacterium]|nr:hypothetical protein [Gammaproteobacteria bacterium]
MKLSTKNPSDDYKHYKRLLFSIIMLLLIKQVKQHTTGIKAHQATTEIFEKIKLPQRLTENQIPLITHNHTQTLINIKNKHANSLLKDIPQAILPNIASYLCDFKIVLCKNSVSLFYDATKANGIVKSEVRQSHSIFLRMFFENIQPVTRHYGAPWAPINAPH